jgi:MFS family permease
MTDNKTGQSFSALNWLNFFAADVATGVGPFLAVYLTTNLKWSAGNIGLAISAMSFATVLAQSPAGFVIDRTPYKKGIIIAASCIMGMIGISIPFFAHFNWIIIAQIIMGTAAAFYGPTLIALATCLAKKEKFDSTITKNQTYNHAGNVVSAVLIGVVGKYTNNEGVFYCLLVLAVMCTVSALYIRSEDIDASPKKEANIEEAKIKNKSDEQKLSLGQMLSNKPFIVFLIAAFIFHFANGAMLPLVGQELGKGKHENASLYMSACIVIAQLVMIPVTYLCGLKVKNGRKWLLIIAFIVLPIRGVLYTFNTNAIYLVSVQVLDGIAAGIFAVVSILVVSDIMGNSGKASLAQGILATAVGLGASLSNLVSGYIVEAEGFNFGFLSLSGLAVGALILLWTSMPETLQKQGNKQLSI